MHFWLVLLTEHNVFHCYTGQMRSNAAWKRDSCTRLVASLQQTVDASKFTTLVAQFPQQPSCTILLDRWRFLIRITYSCKIFMILFNFYRINFLSVTFVYSAETSKSSKKFLHRVATPFWFFRSLPNISVSISIYFVQKTKTLWQYSDVWYIWNKRSK